MQHLGFESTFQLPSNSHLILFVSPSGIGPSPEQAQVEPIAFPPQGMYVVTPMALIAVSE